MNLSIFDIFKVGVGPSSSHTVGPMRAAGAFVRRLAANGSLARVTALRVELYGSLAATGNGHATDLGVMLGLMGLAPDTVDPGAVALLIGDVRHSRRLPLGGNYPVSFDPANDLAFRPDIVLPEHPNALRLQARDSSGQLIDQETYLSVGGGFIATLSEWHDRETTAGSAGSGETGTSCPYPFSTAAELLAQCRAHGLTIAELMRANECVRRSEAELHDGLLHLWDVMQACIDRGCGLGSDTPSPLLPGPLQVRRRAPSLYQRLKSERKAAPSRELVDIDWLNLYAMAVNEENAAGGRVVTAPTNGAAGIVPAVLAYHQRHVAPSETHHRGQVIDYLLTAAAIGMLYKQNASISGAEVGCQGEVGVACSMAAGAFAAIMGATVGQVENAAEIGMEHNLGLTCDPVGGLVQIPCIERNAMGAVKAVNAAHMALLGDGEHRVSLDTVIRTMKQTGADMSTRYKETSLGGLAVNVVEC